MKNFIVIALVGMSFIFLAFAFIKNNINSSTWHEETRAVFVFFSVGWMLISAVIAVGMNDLKNK